MRPNALPARRATLLACAAAALGVACGSSDDATDAGATDVVASDTGASDAGTPDTGTPDTGGPVDGGPLRAVSLAASSAGHTCAVMSDGTVRCWGINDNGQLGESPADSSSHCTVGGTDPVSVPCEKTPHLVAGVTDARQVVTGNGSTCVVRADGTVLCWGLNNAGELGTGTTTQQATPTPTPLAVTGVRQISLGTFHGCAVLTAGTVMCWGANQFGQTGTAVAASMQCDEGDGTPVACVPTPTLVPNLSGVVEVSAGRNHTCARLGDNTVRCWGLNDAAQLGLGRVDETEMPQVAPMMVAITDAAQVSAGGTHTCVRRTDATLSCWGWGGLGQLGGVAIADCGGSLQCAQSPGAVAGLTDVAVVATGRYHTCVALAGGGVRCFGRDDNGQLGRGVASTDLCAFLAETVACARTPQSVAIANAVSVSVGDYHSCALTTDGVVRCWGYDAFGQLGDGATTDQNSPVTARLTP